MANTFRPKKKAEKEPQRRDSKLLANDNRLKFLLGVFLVFFTFFLLISFCSYLFTGASDQDIVHSSLRELAGRTDTKTDNILGLLGLRSPLVYLCVVRDLLFPGYPSSFSDGVPAGF
ncbi:MAG: hypothetical protein LRY55_02520 [Leadbetterella sp.]|nr:hypothetical protein [Leadbetterella sp.]